jgi:hypothetical protein
LTPPKSLSAVLTASASVTIITSDLEAASKLECSFENEEEIDVT